MPDTTQPITEARVQELIDTSLVNLRNSTELLPTRTSAPTHTPKNVFEQIWLTANSLYWYDNTNSVWKQIPLGGLLHSDITNTSINNTTDESTLATYTVPANIMGTNNMVRAKLYLDTILAYTTGQNMTLRAKFGSDTIAFSDNDFDNDNTKDGWLEFSIFNNGSTSSQGAIFSGQGFYSEYDNVGSNHRLDFVSQDAFTQDTTTDTTLSFTVQFSTANSSNAVSTSFFQVELLTT